MAAENTILEENAQQDLLLQADSFLFSPENSKFELDPLRDSHFGKEKTARFTAMNRRSRPYKRQLELKAELSDRDEKKFSKCDVTVQQNGQHIITYIPMRRGDKLHITANDSPIPGSPFKMTVLPTPERFQHPTGVIRDVKKPKGVAVNSKGQIVVVEPCGTAISVLAAAERIRSFGSVAQGSSQQFENGEFDNAYSVTVDKEDNVYVVDNLNPVIQKFDSSGSFVCKVGTHGKNTLQFIDPIGITYNHHNNLLYLADKDNHRIQVLTTDLTFVRAFGEEGTGNGEFKCPVFVAFDSANNIYVSDSSNDQVQVLSPKGQFLRSLSEKSNGQKLNRPWAIAIDSSNSVFVSEFGICASCVSVFSSRGDYITSFKPGITPCGLAVDKNDTLIVPDYYEGCLHLF